MERERDQFLPIGRSREFNRQDFNLHLVFIDLEKVYNRVPKEIMRKILEKKGR
ncbi:hypothetical protein MTR_4g010230 [Medicago truncatula]|uniref:Uncharacterized protein n=1 Tax=Medicago truncatula TaxID=3880 RepID=G7JGY6_MEDTR|nr:hypothetical protein MTR_4g010230 [Medicago truncatula]